MKDRISTKPNRMLVTPENGSAPFYATVTRADEPTQEGTPLNKANLFNDASAALFGLTKDAVPNDVYAKIKSLIDSANSNANSKAKITYGSYVGTGTYGSSNKNNLTFSFNPKMVVIVYRIYAAIFVFSDADNNVDRSDYFSAYYNNFWQRSTGTLFRKNNNNLTWYAEDADRQGNARGVTYRYVAFG